MKLPPHRLGTAALIACLIAPLGVAVYFLHGRDYAPFGDAAMIEQRVRDVGSAHTPLVGAPGRMSLPGRPTHHPGPLGYYLLAIPYRALGSSGWALQAATTLASAIAVALLVWVAERKIGRAGALGVAMAVAVLIQGYGLSALTEPWNPYFAVLWFALFLLCMWLVACGRYEMLPLTAISGSFCAQAHVAYVAVCGGLGACVIVVAGAYLGRHSCGRDVRRRAVRSAAIATGAVVVLWLPPVVEAIGRHGGNLSALVAYFRHPPGPSIGLLGAVPLMLERLDAWHLVVVQSLNPGGLVRVFETPAPRAEVGAITGGVWLASALGAVWLRHRPLLVLHGLVATCIGVGLVAMSRIVGGAYFYLLLWGWCIGALLLLSVCWTLYRIGSRFPAMALQRRLARSGKVALAASIALLATRTALTAPDAGPGGPRIIERLLAVATPTVEAIAYGIGLARGYAGTYLVTSSDAFHGSALELGLANELERAGLRAGVGTHLAHMVGSHRTYTEREATARVQLATGIWVERWRAVPDAVEVTYFDPRSDAEVEEFAHLRAAVAEELQRQGHAGAIQRFDESLQTPFPLHPFLALAVGRIAEIGGPVAVFIVPVGCDARARCKRRPRDDRGPDLRADSRTLAP